MQDFQMTENHSGESKRRLLKSFALGGGAVVAGKSFPESWVRPVVESVVLTAHAQMSACCLTAATYCDSLGTTHIAIELSVAVDGAISINFSEALNPSIATATAKVDCAGGFFSSSVSGNGHVTVSGTVTCGAISIDGSVSSAETGRTEHYSATISACP
jgi:hypothetical protein